MVSKQAFNFNNKKKKDEKLVQLVKLFLMLVKEESHEYCNYYKIKSHNKSHNQIGARLVGDL